MCTAKPEESWDSKRKSSCSVELARLSDTCWRWLSVNADFRLVGTPNRRFAPAKVRETMVLLRSSSGCQGRKFRVDYINTG